MLATESIRQQIVLLKEGRGKTGEAKNGNVRMLFLNDEDHDNFHSYIRRRWEESKNAFGEDNVIPFKEYFSNSYDNLLGKKIKDLYVIKAATGEKLCFVNTNTLNPQINIFSVCERELLSED